MPKSTKGKQASNSDLAPDETGIVVTSQQSRFHADALDDPESKEIDIKDLTVSIHDHELLSHAHLRIREGVHYVFAGRNGTGKSTLLKALAEGRIPGVALNLRILLLGQTGLEDRIDIDENEAWHEETVLEHVMRSDKRRERAVKDEKVLSKAVEDADSSKAAKVVRQLRKQQIKRELHVAQLIAARRSGARGARARQVLIEKEKELEDAEESLVDADAIDPLTAEAELSSGLERLSSLREALSAMAADTTESHARRVLLGLGFQATQLSQPFISLSGGWQTRCGLAAALTQQTDVLLLDEPTNYLDLPAVLWLERYITTNMPNTSVVVVTHDRDFADAVGEELILLRLNPARTLETFRGNLAEYEAEKRRQIKRWTTMKEANERKKEHLQDGIDKNLKAAKKSGDDKKLKQVASKKKKLGERMGVEVGINGGRFKLNRDRAGYHATARAEIEIPGMDPKVNISLPEQPSELRFPGPLASLEKVCYRYAKAKVDVLKDVDLFIHPGERVGLAGLNGSGKSTLVKLLLAASTAGRMTPTKGTITTHPKARIECYSQHAVEELEDLGRREPTRTALAHLLDHAAGDQNEQEARAMLAKLGLKGSFASDVPLRALSGGQRVRLALAQAVASSPHLLILDEVTTHLDSDSIIALIEALKRWEGALLVITHDRFFMRCVVEGESVHQGGEVNGEDSESDDEEENDTSQPPGKVYRLRNGVLKCMDHGMRQYEELVMKSVVKMDTAM